jgi:hypothetical protein
LGNPVRQVSGSPSNESKPNTCTSRRYPAICAMVSPVATPNSRNSPGPCARLSAWASSSSRDLHALAVIMCSRQKAALAFAASKNATSIRLKLSP